MGAVAAGLAILITLNLGGKIDQSGKEEVAQKVEDLINRQTDHTNTSGESEKGTFPKIQVVFPVNNASSAKTNNASGKVKRYKREKYAGQERCSIT